MWPAHHSASENSLLNRWTWDNRWFDRYPVVDYGMEVMIVAGTEMTIDLRVGEAHGDSCYRMVGRAQEFRHTMTTQRSRMFDFSSIEYQGSNNKTAIIYGNFTKELPFGDKWQCVSYNVLS